MADRSLIEWTDTTWQIVTGCSVVSPGCTNCYAMRLAGTRMKHHPSRAGLTVDSKAGPVWNGQVRFNAQWLTQPLRWKRPRRIFVAAHGDLFHEGVTDDQLDQIFAVMALSPQHTFQILTKRPERMRAYLDTGFNPVIQADVRAHAVWQEAFRVNRAEGRPDSRFTDALNAQGCAPGRDRPWPLPNVWLGVSVEDQARADERIPPLLETPAAFRWISAEPLLGPVALDHLPWPHRPHALVDGWSGVVVDGRGDCDLTGAIDWVVAGGESGPGARPMHPDWARQLRDQCAAAGVPFLFKQWGEWREFAHVEDGQEVHEVDADSDEADAWMAEIPADRRCFLSAAGSAFHGHPDNLPEEVPHRLMERIGKKAAGRLLDGQLHDAFPEVKS